jgi:hypothetical protein
MTDLVGKIEQIMIRHSQNTSEIVKAYDKRVTDILVEQAGNPKEEIAALIRLRNEFANFVNSSNFKELMTILQVFDDEVDHISKILNQIGGQ